MNKRAIISGISGQDGSYLAEYLLKKNYKVYGIIRNFDKKQFQNLETLKIKKKIHFLKSEISQHKKIASFIKKIKPDMFFNFAAISSLKESYKNFLYTDLINNRAVLNIMECIKIFSKKTRFFQASSSELFKKSKKNINENSEFNPESPYAISKLSTYYYGKIYRNIYKIYIVNGFLFNHDSPLRRDEFVIKKIIKGLVDYKYNKKKFKKIKLGNIYIAKDRGDAEEYVKIIYKILKLRVSDDYIIASGKAITLKELINLSAKYLKINLKWINVKTYTEKAIDANEKTIIQIEKKLFRKDEFNYVIGNISKIKTILKLNIKSNINLLIKKMIKFEINNVKN
jgi:GDPmannose 4,6-dehydratase